MASRGSVPSQIGTRYRCMNRRAHGAGLTHTEGDGKPTRQKCANCGGSFTIEAGYYFVLALTPEQMYVPITQLPPETAVNAFRTEKQANEWVAKQGEDFAHLSTVRWMDDNAREFDAMVASVRGEHTAAIGGDDNPGWSANSGDDRVYLVDGDNRPMIYGDDASPTPASFLWPRDVAHSAIATAYVPSMGEHLPAAQVMDPTHYTVTWAKRHGRSAWWLMAKEGRTAAGPAYVRCPYCPRPLSTRTPEARKAKDAHIAQHEANGDSPKARGERTASGDYDISEYGDFGSDGAGSWPGAYEDGYTDGYGRGSRSDTKQPISSENPMSYQRGYDDGFEDARASNPNKLESREAVRAATNSEPGIERTALGEKKAPPKVDTLRDEACPVCGETEAYSGNDCAVCGFIKPPDAFLDPDVEKAKDVNLRQEDQAQGNTPSAPASLQCDNCGATFGSEGEASAPGTAQPAAPSAGGGLERFKVAKQANCPDCNSDRDHPRFRIGRGTCRNEFHSKAKTSARDPYAEGRRAGGGQNPNWLYWNPWPIGTPEAALYTKGWEDASGQKRASRLASHPDDAYYLGQTDGSMGIYNNPYDAYDFRHDLYEAGWRGESLPKAAALPAPTSDGDPVDEDPTATAPKDGDACPECGEGTLHPVQAAPSPAEGSPPPPQQAPAEPGDVSNEKAPADGEGDPKAPKPDESNPEEQPSEDEDDEDDEANPKAPKDRSKGQKESKKMRPTLRRLAEQQVMIETLGEGMEAIAAAAGLDLTPLRQKAASRMNALHKGAAAIPDGPVAQEDAAVFSVVAATRKVADVENPANPIPEPAAGAPAPSMTTEVAKTPAATTDVTTPGIGGEVLTDGVTPAANTSLQDAGTVLDQPLNLNQEDVTQPVAGTTENSGANKVEHDISSNVDSPPVDGPAFPLQGPFAEQAKVTGAASESRTFASIHLARLRIQAGIVPAQDDIVLAQSIAKDASITDAAIAAETATLDQVVRANTQNQPVRPVARSLVPRAASAGAQQVQERGVPSLVTAAAASPVGGPSNQAVTADEVDALW